MNICGFEPIERRMTQRGTFGRTDGNRKKISSGSKLNFANFASRVAAVDGAKEELKPRLDPVAGRVLGDSNKLTERITPLQRQFDNRKG